MGFYRDFSGGSIDSPSRPRRPVQQDNLDRWHEEHPRQRGGNFFQILRKGIVVLIILLVLFYLANSYGDSSKESLNKFEFDFNQSFGNFLENVSPPSQPITDKTYEVEAMIFLYTNEERQLNGVAPLSWNDSLADIAREHSLDMATNNFFEHDNLQGEDPTARARRHGFPVEVQVTQYMTQVGIGENIGMMPTGNVEGRGYVGSDANSVAQAQVQSWMESPGHRTNMLDSSYHIIGVGVAYSGGYYYNTQDFQ